MTSGPSPNLTASVVIVTYNRPDYVRTSLERVLAQTVPAHEIIVVDASPAPDTRDLVAADFRTVRYLRNPRGYGTMATSRDIGLRASSGDVVAFIDDDAFAEPQWLAELLVQYADPTVGGVGGLARNGQPGEATEGVDQIGRFLPDGRLTGYFSADPGKVVEVAHLVGTNMSFRRQILLDNGGIHDNYPGTCLREETDIAFRVRQAGWRLVFTPFAAVDHMAGPYAKGKRFDMRYLYYSQRNHMVLLGVIGGFKSTEGRRYVGVSAREALGHITTGLKNARDVRTRGVKASARSVAGGVARAFVLEAGVAAGTAVLARERFSRKR